MIPLTVTREELALARELGRDGDRRTSTRASARSPEITIGTMIETPRAALRADEIAEESDFFSFGTNDLTQMAFGFSRDDVESRMMPAYLEQGLLKRNPFETIDRERRRRARQASAPSVAAATKPKLKLGVCGEHGGDPESIAAVLRRRPRLRQLLAVPRADRPPGRRPGDRRLGRVDASSEPVRR